MINESNTMTKPDEQ